MSNENDLSLKEVDDKLHTCYICSSRTSICREVPIPLHGMDSFKVCKPCASSLTKLIESIVDIATKRKVIEKLKGPKEHMNDDPYKDVDADIDDCDKYDNDYLNERIAARKAITTI